MVLSPATPAGRPLEEAGRRGRTPASLCRRAGGSLLLLLLALPLPAWSLSCIAGSPLFQVSAAGESPLRQPSDLAVAGDRLFVLDDLNGRVAAYDMEGRHLFNVPLPGGGATAYLGMDIGGDDSIYLAAPEEGKIVILDKRGAKVRDFPTGKERSEPVAIDVSRGQCFVVDNEEHGVKVFDLNGSALQNWGEPGEGSFGFRYPFRLRQDDLGRILVTDTLNSRIKVFTPKGEALLDFGEFGVTEGTLFRPAGLTPWGSDRVMVADNYHGAVQLFDLRGQYLSTLCGPGGTPLLFSNPVSLAARGSTLFVLEMGAGRVRAFEVR